MASASYEVYHSVISNWLMQGLMPECGEKSRSVVDLTGILPFQPGKTTESGLKTP
jgi:hypothetical protein